MGIFSSKSDPTRSREDIIERFVFEALREQRRSRRFRYFALILTFTYLFSIPFLLKGEFSLDTSSGKQHSALVDIEGVIADDTDASADKIVSGLRKAFEADNVKGVILRINSPGGSPVQAAYVNKEIARLREEHKDIPLYAVITDVCASGGYYIAAAADKIYAHPSSIVGSIGVLMNGFGFADAMKNLGIERRLYTAGENKGMLDPFSPVNPAHVTHIQTLLDNMHDQFIEVVKSGRGEKLSDDPKIFSGLFWSGEQAKELGLVDEFASAGQVAREVLEAEDIVNYTPKEDYLERLTERLGASFAKVFAREMQHQAVQEVR